MELSKKSKKSEKKGIEASPLRARRTLGVCLLFFGALGMLSLILFVGNGAAEKSFLSWTLPQAISSAVGTFPATVLSIALVCFGIWNLRTVESPRLFRVSVGFSMLFVLCAAIFSLLAAHASALTLDTKNLAAAGGQFGFFLVHAVLWKLFGENSFAVPMACLCVLLFVNCFVFGLRPSHFAFLKKVGGFLAGFFAGRQKENSDTASPEPKAEKLSAAEKSLERAKKKALAPKPEPEWNDDYTIFHGTAKPFRGPAGAFGTSVSEENVSLASETVPSNDLANAPTEIPADGLNAAEREIAEKERYLRENEWHMGALEVRSARDEIAHLRQVQQVNVWENNRGGKPSIQGIVERSEPAAEAETVVAEPVEALPAEPTPAEKTVAAETPEILPETLPQEIVPERAPTIYDEYLIPKVEDILDVPPEQKPDYTVEELDVISHQLEEQLENFHVKGKVNGISTGPMITRFEVEPGPGVKVSRFAALHEDLALALRAKSIRILAPIPGKSLVGVEVPNRKLQTVYCRDIFESKLFEPKPDKLIIALGKDITGNPYTMDLCRAPHILIAGQTGSGKSVCINTIMASLLFSKTPDELRMILVDPKVVELKLYENIPHLMAPVVTQPDQAVAALRWACVEMDRRYGLLAEYKVRNLVGYNQKRREQLERLNAENAAAENPAGVVEGAEALPKLPENSEEPMEVLPYIVIVVDELADLMMVAGKDVEKYIARIAQKARAVGIHLVIATQRPSVNVITGLIKANLPARISFKVASQVDSRTVMDRAGAEKLLGRGDMLYRSGDDPEPIRVHGGFLTDEEVEKLADACSEQNVHYDKLESFEIEDPSEMDEGEGGKVPSKLDPKALDVARFGLQRGGISISEVQRQFEVGFSRAGKIVDQLEKLRICGPKKGGSKPREMLVHSEEELFNLWQK